MPEAFVQLPFDEQASILQTCAGKLGRRPEHLEKDVWICWVLQALFTMPNRLPMAFKGGTSLSKVYGAIRRFSEDVDVTVDTNPSTTASTLSTPRHRGHRARNSQNSSERNSQTIQRM